MFWYIGTIYVIEYILNNEISKKDETVVSWENYNNILYTLYFILLLYFLIRTRYITQSLCYHVTTLPFNPATEQKSPVGAAQARFADKNHFLTFYVHNYTVYLFFF